MNAVDTNILIYAQDSRERSKQHIAKELIASLYAGVLLWQVACEYVAASRKLAPLGFNHQQAFAELSVLSSVWQKLNCFSLEAA